MRVIAKAYHLVTIHIGIDGQIDVFGIYDFVKCFVLESWVKNFVRLVIACDLNVCFIRSVVTMYTPFEPLFDDIGHIGKVVL